MIILESLHQTFFMNPKSYHFLFKFLFNVCYEGLHVVGNLLLYLFEGLKPWIRNLLFKVSVWLLVLHITLVVSGMVLGIRSGFVECKKHPEWSCCTKLYHITSASLWYTYSGVTIPVCLLKYLVYQ